MDAVREEHLLGVDPERLPVGAGALALVTGQHALERFAEQQIVAVLLVPEDIAARQARLIEIIREFLLLQGKLLEARDLIAQHLDVGKAVRLDGKWRGGSRRSGARGGQCAEGEQDQQG